MTKAERYNPATHVHMNIQVHEILRKKITLSPHLRRDILNMIIKINQPHVVGKRGGESFTYVFYSTFMVVIYSS